MLGRSAPHGLRIELWAIQSRKIRLWHDEISRFTAKQDYQHASLTSSQVEYVLLQAVQVRKSQI